jgi:ligand-binding sensor domain-containing protein
LTHLLPAPILWIVNSSAAACGRLASACLVATIAGIAPPASALDPGRAVTQYSLRHWRGSADFPQDATIQAIAQTPDGYLWLGTMEGVLRFDGVRTTRFAGAAAGLPSDNVWGLQADSQGRVWIATHGGGVAVWDKGTTKTFSTASGLNHDLIRPIIEARDGAIWIGTNAGVSYYKDGRWKHLGVKEGLAAGAVWALAAAPEGGVWVGAMGLNFCENAGCRVVRQEKDGLPANGVTSLAVARNGDVWVGMWSGVSRRHDGQWTDWRSGHGLPSHAVRAIREDRDGNIWLGTQGGLTRFRDGAFSALMKDQGAASAYVRALYEDGEGTLWVGAVSAGLTALANGQFLNIGETEGLPHRNVRLVLESPAGDLLASGGTSLSLSRIRDGRVEALPALPSQGIRSLALDPADPEALWIGLASHTVVYWKEGRGVVHSYTPKEGLVASAPARLHVDRSGALWAGGLDGLSERRNGAWRVYTTAQGLQSSSIFSITDGRDGTVWIGTSAGVALWRDGSVSTSLARNPGPRTSVYSLYQDADGVLWAGTNDGLWRLENENWTHFDLAHGFCSDTTNFLIEDDLGFFWATSPKGLCRVERRALNAFARGESRALPWRLYDRSDGIRDTDFGVGHSPKGWKTRDGRLLFASSGGIVAVDPRKLHVGSAPPATIEALTADNVPVVLNAPIALGPGRPRLEFRFTALTLVAPEKLRFKYKLEGFDPDWIEAAGHRLASYTNIPPGDYTFRVNSVTSDGIWNESGTPLHFRMKPQFWETSWFRILSVFAALAAAAAAYSWRVRRMHALAEELERRVQEGLQHIQTLKGLLPICASCKKIRDDGGYWNQIETYVSHHSAAEFSHSICPECMPKLYPEYAAAQAADQKK